MSSIIKDIVIQEKKKFPHLLKLYDKILTVELDQFQYPNYPKLPLTFFFVK